MSAAIAAGVTMFKWLNKQGVESDRGFVVQFTGRFAAEYRERAGRVTLAIEDGFADARPCILIDPCAFDAWDDGTAIPPDRRAELFQNLKDALEFQGLGLRVEAGEPPPA